MGLWSSINEKPDNAWERAARHTLAGNRRLADSASRRALQEELGGDDEGGRDAGPTRAQLRDLEKDAKRREKRIKELRGNRNQLEREIDNLTRAILVIESPHAARRAQDDIKRTRRKVDAVNRELRQLGVR